jgi:predicted dehydrogenase
MVDPVTFVLIGAGNRGRGIFGQYAIDKPDKAKFVAVVEPEASRRMAFAQAHSIPDSHQFCSIQEFFERFPERIADAAIIATLEDVREEPIARSLAAGYAILCEKPLALTPGEIIRLTALANSFDGIFMVCHQMRYAPLYRELRGVVASGEFGKIVSVEHVEHLSYHHIAHSFVRGFFNNDRLTPMILAKACHDMDILLYLIDSRPARVASFGGRSHFRQENAPAGSPAFCLDGCPVSEACLYHVGKAYFGADADPAYLRQMGVIKSTEELVEKLRSNRFGRCVYRCDNNVVDHQICSFEFQNGVTASFSMTGHNAVERRATRLMMETAEVFMDSNAHCIEIQPFGASRKTVLTPKIAGTHGGGDTAIMDDFVNCYRANRQDLVLTSVRDSLDSHLMAFAAEESRKSHQVVEMGQFEASFS